MYKQISEYRERVEEESEVVPTYYKEPVGDDFPYAPVLFGVTDNDSFVALYYDDNGNLTLEAYDSSEDYSRFIYPDGDVDEVAYKFAALIDYLSN